MLEKESKSGIFHPCSVGTLSTLLESLDQSVPHARTSDDGRRMALAQLVIRYSEARKCWDKAHCFGVDIFGQGTSLGHDRDIDGVSTIVMTRTGMGKRFAMIAGMVGDFYGSIQSYVLREVNAPGVEPGGEESAK